MQDANGDILRRLGFEIRNKRALRGRKVDYLRESNDAKLVAEAAIPEPTMAMESAFYDSWIEIIKH